MGDEEATIKLATDVDQAILGLAEVIGSFQSISEAVEQVTADAEAFGVSASGYIEDVRDKLAESSLASTDFGQKFAASLDEIGAKLKERDDALAASNASQEAAYAEGILSVQALAAVEKAYTDQKIADEAQIAAMSAESKAAIDKSTEALLEQGVSFAKVAESAGLTKEQLTILVTEQDKLAESSKGFLERITEGMKGSEVATVTAGVLMADALKGVGSAMLDVVKSFPAMISAAASAGDQLQTMSNRFNISVESIDRMQFVADQANVSFEGMARASQKLAQSLSDDTSKASLAFEEMGLDAAKLREKPEEALYAFVKAVKETVPPADQAAKMVEVLGSRAGQLTGLLKEKIPELLKDADALGASAEATRIVADEGEKYQDNLGRIKRAQEAWRTEIASHFLPAMNKVLEIMPEAGGLVLTFGEGLLSAGSKMLPLITNIMALKGSGFLTMLTTWAGGMFGVSTATGAAAVATEGATVAVGGLTAALGPLALALGAAYAIWTAWEGASKESGWIRYVSDGFERLTLSVMGYTKAETEAIIKQQHGTQKAKEAGDAAAKLAEIQKKAADEAQAAADLQEKALAKQGNALQRLKKESDAVQKAFNALTDEQEAQIKASLRTGASAEELGKALHGQMKVSTDVATEAIKLFDKALKDADQAAKKLESSDPFRKMAKSAQELGAALSASGSASIEQLVAEYGKQAFEVVNLAATMKDGLKQIGPAAMEVAAAFQRAEIDKKLTDIKEKSEEAATAISTKMREAATSAVAAMKGMADSMTALTLSGDELRLFQINKQKDDTIAAQEAISTSAVAARTKEFEAAQKAYDEDKKFLEAKKLAGQEVALADQIAIAEALERRQNAADAAMVSAQQDAQNQIGLAQMVADQQVMILKEGTGNYETDAAARGVITAAAAKKELKAQQDKLRLMKDAQSGATKYEIEKQEELVATMQNLTEKDFAQRGVITTAAREKEYVAAKAALDKMLQAQKDGTAKFYQWEIEAKKAEVALMESEWEKEAAALGLITTGSATLVVGIEERKLKAMLAHEQDFTKKQIKEQEERVEAAKVAAGLTSKAWEESLGKTAELLKEMGAAFTKIGEAAGSPALLKIGKTLDFSATIATGVKGLLEAKDTLGAIIAAAKLAADAFAGMWDAFTESKGEKAMKSIGKNFRDSMGEALDVSEEFGDKIAASAKDMFGGSDFQAQLYHLNDIIEEAGGLSEKNFENMTGRLRDVFTQVGKGSFTVEHATKVLDENFTTFADSVLESGKIASAGFREIIALNAQFGTQSKEIAEFVTGQVGVLGEAFAKLLAPIEVGATRQSEKISKEFEKLDKLTKDRDKLLAEFATEGPDRMGAEAKNKLAELTAEWERQSIVVNKNREELKLMAADAMPELQRAGRLLMASFNGATASGVSMLDAVDQLGPGLDSLIESTAHLGLTAEEAGWKWIADFRDRVNVNRELVDSAGSLNEIMMAMSNIGALNADSFADLQAQGMDTYTSLREAGFDENEALKMMQGYLEQVRNAHTDMGLPIDENTQSLLDQATASGVLKAEQVSTNDIMMQGLGAIIKALGGEMPAAFDKMQKSAVGAASTLGKAMDTKVGLSIEETSEKIDETDWEGYAEKGVSAAEVTKEPVDELGASVLEVGRSLTATDWSGWADEAVAAMEKVQEAVDAVSLGHSPGGIKEMPIKLNEAMRSFRQWEKQGVMSAEAVEDAINNVGASAVAKKEMNMATTQAFGVQSIGDIHVSINTEGIDSSQRAREVAEEMMNEFTQILSRRVQYSVAN